MGLQISLLLIILLTKSFEVITSLSNPTYLDSRCANGMMFTPNSTYQSDVESVFVSLTSKAAKNTAGNSTYNDVYGLYLCRGDLTTASCKECVVAATVGLSGTYCPLKKAGVIWYAECMVRYSNESFFGKLVELPRVIIGNSRSITGNKSRLSEVLRNSMSDLVVTAGNSSVSSKTFFEMVEIITTRLTLRVFGQCTADLIGKDCGKCLRISVDHLRVGVTGRVLQPSCNVWYEVYESHNISSSSNLMIMNQNGKKQLSAELMVASIVPVASVLIAVFVLCLIAGKSSTKSGTKIVDDELKDLESLRYNLATLQCATNNFSVDNEIGRGGLGMVYKGILCDGKQVAVKRLHSTFAKVTNSSAVQEFKNELLSVAKVQHRNLVNLLGFCFEENEMLLVFEYLPYNVYSHVLDQERNQRLEWSIRLQIINGIAKGMLYLHQDSRLRIIHRDLNARNILLDGDMNPKIADFGMAKIFGIDQTQGNTSRIVGTYGYMSPEYAIHGKFSVKSDVYSFGVLVLEILSGKKNSSFYESGYAEDLLSYVREKWNDGRVLELVDESIRGSYNINQVERCVHLGLLCTEESIDRRPTMATVVLMLESQSITLPMPEQPAYMSREESSSTPNLWSMNGAVNGGSISDIEPR